MVPGRSSERQPACRGNPPLCSAPLSSALLRAPATTALRLPAATCLSRAGESRGTLFTRRRPWGAWPVNPPPLPTPSPPVPPPPLLLIRRQKYSRGSGCELGCALGEHAAQTPQSANQTFCQPRPVQSYSVCRLCNNNHTTVLFFSSDVAQHQSIHLTVFME